MKAGWKLVAQAGVLLAVGAGSFLAGSSLDAPAVQTTGERETARINRFTSPYIECVGESPVDRGMLEARGRVEQVIEEARAADPSLHVSVYGRDLHDGAWMGIDETEPYVPASLLKVHLLAYLLAQSEDDPTLLQRQVVYPGPSAMKSVDTTDGAPAELRMRAGASYTYEELLERMIVNSDNHALELLMTGTARSDVDAFLQTFNAAPITEGGQSVVTARSFSTVFRILYNASLLSRSTSEYALEMLTRTRFDLGFRKYLPPSVTVASKFGFQDYTGRHPAKIQVHECGIIYAPEGPYTLCVLTRSNHATPEMLAEVIASVSRAVWEEKQG